MLKVSNLTGGYGSIRVLHSIALEVREKELVSLVGANGAGKTTFLRAVSGLLPQRKGRITFADTDVTRMAPDRLVSLGLIHVPEGRKLFPSMSVLENLELGAIGRRAKKQKNDNLAHVFEFFPRLKERLRQQAGTLSGGEQQMLAIGRGLMGCPRLLILDEPSIGLSPVLTETLFHVIEKINKEGIAILLVEQNVQHALGLAARGYVIENGNIVMEGTGRQLLADKYLKKAYLGM